MTGLDKMIAQITDEAQAEAQTTVAAARDEAAGLAAEAEKEAQKISDTIAKQTENEAARYMERVESSAQLRRRTALLTAKQEVIAGVLEKAYQSIDSLGDADYFDLIRKLLTKYVQGESGVIQFSQRDLDRLPAGFEAEIQETAAAKGGALALSQDPASIANGFILVYGGVEENCTFRSLFDTQKDDLSDLVHKELFS